MSWTNVLLIFRREVRDQLRDRRTLFTVVVLPLLLYPLLGATFLQIAQFMRQHAVRIQILGAEHLPDDPPLIEDGRFAGKLVADGRSALLELTLASRSEQTLPAIADQARRDLQAGRFDVVVYFPPDFASKLAEFRAALRQRSDNIGDATAAPPAATIPQPVIFKNTAVEKSQLAFLRVDNVLERWRDEIVRDNLEQSRIPVQATEPFQIDSTDFATASNVKAALWSKVLPFVLLIWALTGAFYPAVDLCAGEKERGTLETLLCSPALRTEIVWGKLFTVMTFSMATALLNLASMGFTGMLIARQLMATDGMGPAQFGAPPLTAVAWLLVALPPMSALFSALALAIASFARSSKEGQYYLMPLLMVMMPLMTLPMLPAAQLDLGTSLIPVTGMMLLLRSLMEGQVLESLRYAVPVVLVTGVCCLMAVRWAVDQFNRESVLFRESEQWGLGLWLRHLMRDRGDTPNFAEAMLCAVLLLVIRFFAGFLAGVPGNFAELRTSLLVTQLAFIAAPPLLMAVMLTRRPAKALLLSAPSFAVTVPAAMLLAAALHPAMMVVAQLIQQLYPFSPDIQAQLKPFGLLLSDAPLGQILLLVCLAPAVCEELAFRGFVLSGLRRIGHKWTAIVLTAAFFGAVHVVLQQSIAAFVVGIVLGYVAVKTGSILPAMAYHFTHNALSVLAQRVTGDLVLDYPVLRLVYERASDGESWGYSNSATVIATLAGIAVLLWYKSLPYEATREELLEETRDRRQQPAVAAQASSAGASAG
jgi:sodium transport system permease protein